MIDFEDSVQGTHDTYLKTYQLRKPKIWGYDVILIDEAQDMTPGKCILDVRFDWGCLSVGANTL